MFGVSTIEVLKRTQTIPVPELLENDSSLFEGIVSPFEGASDLVDPSLSFDVLSGFVSRSDDVSIASFMDMSLFKYSSASCDNISISVPHSPTSQIFDIDDEIAQPSSDRDSFHHDFDPIDERVSPATRDVETVDFGTEDQPREPKIGSPLSTDERDGLIHLLRSNLDVFAWSYEDMPGLDPFIVKEEIQKQLSIGFISMVEYPEWLANVVPVPKKDGKVRVCVDFRDLNKASPKDDFPSHTLICWSIASQAIRCCLSWMGFQGTTYQRIATTLFHDIMHRDVEVYVDDMILKSRSRTDHLKALERFFVRIQKFRLRLNPKKCTFRVTSWKLLGYMVSDRGIEVDPDKIKVILDMLVPRTKKEIRGQIDDSRKERAIYYLSKRMLEYEMIYVMIERLCLALVWATRRLRHYMIEYSVHLISRLDLLRYLFDKPTLTGRLMRWLPYYRHLKRPVDDDFPDEEFVAMTSLSGWCMYFDGAANQLGYGIVEYEACILGLETTLELGFRHMEVFDDSNLVLRQIQGDSKTMDVKLRPYHANLEMLVARVDDLRYVHLPRAQNRFVDASATLASSVDIPIDVVVRPLLIELRSAPVYYCLIGETEVQDNLPWYDDIYQFLRSGTFPKVATAKDRRALRHLATRFMICGDTLYRGVHFRAEVDTLLQKYNIRHHRSSAYRPQTNEVVEAANKNIKRILRKMVETSRDWSEKLHFALWAYRTSFRTSIGATPYSLVYGIEVVLPVETEMGSLRVALE
ncbi:Retrovirus-related Pol polyprotein from transposon 297 [Vitis vinifera]|uniref:Retrovirus-related Pol polyprotein from transposon 297 n=1 Tax=Vitis vinifera TaxID=29760 RepID=A0A438CAK8_VITVI|nr:Retrovirus-related Pol polyprotein from transposon 297 [Vitis vinifera]